MATRSLLPGPSMLWAVCFGSAAGCSEVKMKKFGAWLSIAVVLLIAPAKAGAASGQASVGAAEALRRLLDGNHRYVEERLIHPNQTTERRATVAGGQHPFAAILGCS